MEKEYGGKIMGFISKIFIVLIMIFCIFIGGYLAFTFQNKLMGKYDLYNCIWSNAESNAFSQDSSLIQEIQNECICFRAYNYTNLSRVNCGELNGT